MSDTRTRIIEVAARLLREHGAGAVTTRRVAEEAGAQAPTIYRLFGDKDGLLDAVAEHAIATFVASKTAVVQAAASDDVDPLDDLRAGWQMQIDFNLANPALFRLLSDPERALRSPAVQAGRRVLETRVHRVARAGGLAVSEARAVGMIQAAGTGATLVLLATPPEQRDAGLPDAMFDAVLAQILTEAPDPAERGPLATAVAFRAVAPELEALSPAERGLLVDWLDRAIDRR